MQGKAPKTRTATIAVGLLLAATNAAAQDGGSRATNKTVIGPRNLPLAEGAEALMYGDAKRGVELTERGLQLAQGNYEKKSALSNLCAGYLLVDRPEDALQACDEVIALDPHYWRAYNNRALVLMRLGRLDESEADVARGEELRPKSKNLKLTRAKLLDLTDPVEPIVEIDERRSPEEDPGGGDKPF